MPSYKDYKPKTTSHTPEEIEWTITYAYDTHKTALPRVLLIGDSICHAYHNPLKEALEGSFAISYWASSKCVTAEHYFRELDLILSYFKYDVISFNNGLHSLNTNREEWASAYGAALDFIKAKCPEAKVFVTLSTPSTDPEITAKSAELNGICKGIAEERGIEVFDLFTPMDKLEREPNWADILHFKYETVKVQGGLLADYIRKITQ